MELKDIVLKKGDIVYFKNAKSRIVDEIYDERKLVQVWNVQDIIKIERPIKYKTIYEAPKEILDKEEKEYLEAVIRPFRDRVKSIMKFTSSLSTTLQAVSIEVRENEIVDLPTFEKNTMYKGMELNKEYTLEELELFKE